MSVFNSPFWFHSNRETSFCSNIRIDELSYWKRFNVSNMALQWFRFAVCARRGVRRSINAAGRFFKSFFIYNWNFSISFLCSKIISWTAKLNRWLWQPMYSAPTSLKRKPEWLPHLLKLKRYPLLWRKVTTQSVKIQNVYPHFVILHFRLVAFSEELCHIQYHFSLQM